MRHKWNTLALGGILLIMAALARFPVQEITRWHGSRLGSMKLSPSLQQQARERFRSLPLTFVRNEGPIDAKVRYYARGTGFAYYFSPREALFAFRTAVPRPTRWKPVGGVGTTRNYRQTERELEGAALAMRFPGASSSVSLEGRGPEDGPVHCLYGKDPARWRTGLTAYREVAYHELWPGVDLVFGGAAGQMACELDLRPGAGLDAVHLAFYGSRAAKVDPAGRLQLRADFQSLTIERPQCYAVSGGERVPVAGHYRLQHTPDGAATVGIAIDAGSRSHHGLVILLRMAAAPPIPGRDAVEVIDDVAVDAQGAAYVTGPTLSVGLPPHPGAFELPYEDGMDAFVVKLTAAGRRYTTYLGGSSVDAGRLIAADRAGNVRLVGVTQSRDFPTTPGAYDRTYNRGWDLFAVALGATGAELLGATYLGGSAQDNVWSFTLDGAGNAHIAGKTDSPDFPVTAGSFAETGGNEFRATLDGAGQHLLSSTPGVGS